jgi:hypothetical protein
MKNEIEIEMNHQKLNEINLNSSNNKKIQMKNDIDKLEI